MDFERVIKWLSWNELPPEFLSSLLVFLIIIILILVVHFKIKKYNPLERPKGFMNAVEAITNFADKQVDQIMGPAFKGYGGFILYCGLYIFFGFLIGMIGLPNILQPTSKFTFEALPNPFTNLAMPLSLALVTFGLNNTSHRKSNVFDKYSFFVYFGFKKSSAKENDNESPVDVNDEVILLPYNSSPFIAILFLVL